MRKILISTNMYKGSEFGQVLPYLKRFPGQVGVEVFPMFHEECFEKNLRDAMPLLKEVPVSFHGPYYQAEHSAAEGTVEYARTMELLEKTLSYAKELSSKYLVYHHNNCRIIPGEKEDRVRVSCENYYTVKQLCEEAGTQVVVENAGVLERGNRLFDEQEFIDLCRREQYAVLIDIGHAWANGWSLKRVVNALADRFRNRVKNEINEVFTQLHNNDGVHDSHQRIHEGTLDFDCFLKLAKQATPDAEWVMEYAMDVSGNVRGIEEDLQFLLKMGSAAR